MSKDLYFCSVCKYPMDNEELIPQLKEQLCSDCEHRIKLKSSIREFQKQIEKLIIPIADRLEKYLSKSFKNIPF
jgi:DNA-directed RNA polymerase subunit RPC12/RpoP